jgi:hypothetical protein
LVLPMWSAAIDPHVLPMRAAAPDPERAEGSFDVRRFVYRILADGTGEHVRIDHAGRDVRLDLVEGTLAVGPVALRFDLPCDRWVPERLDAARLLHAITTGASMAPISHGKLARKLIALQALDRHAAGASLREIAELLLGGGDWPGDGEHRKSQVRRLIAAGRKMLFAGPSAVLA